VIPDVAAQIGFPHAEIATDLDARELAAVNEAPDLRLGDVESQRGRRDIDELLVVARRGRMRRTVGDDGVGEPHRGVREREARAREVLGGERRGIEIGGERLGLEDAPALLLAHCGRRSSARPLTVSSY
jgi:hypothetical protein